MAEAAKSKSEVGDDRERTSEPSKVHTQRHRGIRRRIECDRAPRGTYKSMAEVERARRNGTFDIHRTMFLKNGRLFFMCYD